MSCRSHFAAASARGHVDIVRYLVRNAALVDLQSKTGVTALFFGARKGSTECVKALLGAGGNPNLRDFNVRWEWDKCACSVDDVM